MHETCAHRTKAEVARVFQIERRAIRKIRRAIEREAKAAKVTPREWAGN